MSDILEDYREWLGDRADRVRTHYDRCHINHDACMVVRMASEISRLRAGQEGEAMRIDAGQTDDPTLLAAEVRRLAAALDDATAEIARLRAEVERLRMTSEDREVLRLVAQQCAKRHWSDWATVVDGVLARHGGGR